MDVALAGLILAAIAIVVAIAIVFYVEWLKRPRLEIVTAIWQPPRPVQWTFAVVQVRNRPLGWPFRWLLLRSTAIACEALVEFREPGNRQLAISAVPARWSGQPEPLRSVQVPGNGGKPALALHYDESMVPASRRLDIPPDVDGHELAVAVLRPDGTAHAFGADSYAHFAWKHPDWELERQVYEITVRARASGVTTSRRLWLDNLAPNFDRFITREAG